MRTTRDDTVLKVTVARENVLQCIDMGRAPLLLLGD